ncbi:uncharacterized protein [Aegilops tauschii subsp. strangulata]|uniref:uncharacterized protein n=1 Tax=Aegilops tauschii subsp. strangulata TaxID=200361 RepID=UPI003CC8DCD0
MAEEPSAKRHRGETSDKRSNLDDVHVPGEKREYTKTHTGVELHGKETLEIVCTSEPDKADEMMSRLRMKGGGLYPSFMGVDVEFTRKDETPQMAVVLQLCMEELCLVNHIAAATKCIEGDKRMLNKSGLEINPKNYTDIQRLWRVPSTGKEYDSLADVAASIIHPFYKSMKKKIDRGKTTNCGGSARYHTSSSYAGLDAYTTYKSWKIIEKIVTGWEISKQQEAGPYYH